MIRRYGNGWRSPLERSWVDYVLHSPSQTIAIEVSTPPVHHRRGLDAFAQRFPDAKTLMVGEGGVPFDVFLNMSISDICEALTH